jgi:hypothetical protein
MLQRYIEKPSLPDVQQMTFLSYKNNNTFKALVGISPSGVVTFVSDLYSGSISDKELTRKVVFYPYCTEVTVLWQIGVSILKMTWCKT